MITYKAIDNFLKSLEKLERKGKKNYLKIRQDISDEYSAIEDILELMQKAYLLDLEIVWGKKLCSKQGFQIPL